MIKTNLSAVRMTLSLIALISLEGACSMTPSNQDAQKNDKPQQHTDAPVTKGGTLSLTMPTDSEKRPAAKLRISLVPSVLKLADTGSTVPTASAPAVVPKKDKERFESSYNGKSSPSIPFTPAQKDEATIPIGEAVSCDLSKDGESVCNGKAETLPTPGAVQQYEFDFKAGKVVKIDALQAGQYLMVVDLVDEKGQVIKSGSAQNEIIAGQKQTAEVTLSSTETPASDDLSILIKSEKEFLSSAETAAKTPASDDLSILIKSEKEFLSSAETAAKTPASDDLGHPKQK